MNIIFVTDGSGALYPIDYVSCLASTLRAEGHNVIIFTRSDTETIALNSFSPHKLGNGGMFDILSPVRLANSLRHIEGHTVVHVFTPRDARLALNATKLSERPSEVKVVLSLLDSHNLPKFKKWEQQAIARAHAVTVDVQDALPGAVFIAPGMLDRNIERDTQPSIPNILYIGNLVKGCALPQILISLEDFKDRRWHLEICGTGRGSYIMGPVRRTRASGIDTHITWQGNDYDAMDALSHASVLIGEDSPYVRLMADCAGCALIPSPDTAALSEIIDHPESLKEKGADARRRYLDNGIYSRFYNDIMALYK